MVRYCLEMPYGAIRHFPAGTYDKQMTNQTGKVELELTKLAHSVWLAFKHLSLGEWGDNERRLAKWMMPEKAEPEPLTRRLDSLISRLWPGAWWLQAIMDNLRGIDDG